MPKLNYDDFKEITDTFDLTEEQKRQLIDTVYGVSKRFVEKAFGRSASTLGDSNREAADNTEKNFSSSKQGTKTKKKAANKRKKLHRKPAQFLDFRKRFEF